MKRPVIVAAIGGEYGQAISVVPGANQVIRRRFARSVRAVGLERIGFRKRWVLWRECAVHLIRRYMQKPETLFFCLV